MYLIQICNEYFNVSHGRDINTQYVCILEDNLSRDFLYEMLNIEYPFINNDWLWV